MNIIEFNYIERILNTSQKIYDKSQDNSENIRKLKDLDNLFENYKINIIINVSDHKYEILAKIKQKN